MRLWRLQYARERSTRLLNEDGHSPPFIPVYSRDIWGYSLKTWARDSASTSDSR